MKTTDNKEARFFTDYGWLMEHIEMVFAAGRADSTYMIALVHLARELREAGDPSYLRWKESKQRENR